MGSPDAGETPAPGGQGRARRRPAAPRSDAALAAHAADLRPSTSAARAVPSSVRWVSNQNSRWGSATPSDGTIRLSDKLRPMPQWVIDYVLLHELAHLLVAGHNAAFWRLLEAYPDTQRAKAFLEGVSFATSRGLAADEPGPTTRTAAGGTAGSTRHANRQFRPGPASFRPSPSAVARPWACRRRPCRRRRSAFAGRRLRSAHRARIPGARWPRQPVRRASSKPPLSSFCRASSTSLSLASASLPAFAEALRVIQVLGRGQQVGVLPDGVASVDAALLLERGPQRGSLRGAGAAAVPVPPGRQKACSAGPPGGAAPADRLPEGRRGGQQLLRGRSRELVHPAFHEGQGRLQLFECLLLGGSALRHEDTLGQRLLDAFGVARDPGPGRVPRSGRCRCGCRGRRPRSRRADGRAAKGPGRRAGRGPPRGRRGTAGCRFPAGSGLRRSSPRWRAAAPFPGRPAARRCPWS